MRIRYLAVLLLCVPAVLAQSLPDLGDAAQGSFSPQQERRLGESIMREIRQDPAYYDDAEATDYLNALGNRLVARGATTHQNFEFFLVRDNQINAFALPGGYIGINTGLIRAAQGESELAGVVAHEVAHVTQRHIARMVGQQSQSQLLSLASLAVAILAARSNSDVATAAMAFGQGAVIQSALNFTRDNEREADRVGLQILEGAGYDPRGMAVFFERMQRATRLYEGGAPSYLRTHPLTFERIADIQNRLESLPYRQVADSIEFQLIRSKIRADLDPPAEARAFFEESLRERRFLSEAASRYGLAVALLRQKEFARAREQAGLVRKLTGANPVVETLACRISAAMDAPPSALECYAAALHTYPGYRALAYNYAQLLLANRQPQPALKLIEARLQAHTEDHRLYLLQAEAYAILGQRLSQHRAQGEAYARLGNYSGAVEQLQIALKSGQGNFYELSATEARLRQLRALHEQQRRDQRNERP